MRPYCESYVHVGAPGPRFPVRDLTADQKERFGTHYAKYEEYPEEEPGLGRYWEQGQLDNIGKGCGMVTHMGGALSETYAREPRFYGATYCVGCRRHLKVGTDGEFFWSDGAGRPKQYEGKDWRVGT